MKILNQVAKLGLIAVFAMGVLSFVACGEEKSPLEQMKEIEAKQKEEGYKPKEKSPLEQMREIEAREKVEKEKNE